MPHCYSRYRFLQVVGKARRKGKERMSFIVKRSLGEFSQKTGHAKTLSTHIGQIHVKDRDSFHPKKGKHHAVPAG
jgi:hypothetical protein